MQQAEQKLVQRALPGNQPAYTSLYRTHHARIVATVAQHTRNSDDVEDLVQQSFIRTFRSLAKFRGDAACSTWLTRIALNVCYTHYKQQRPTLPLEAIEHGPESAGRCPKPGPDQILQQKQQARQVVRAIAALPDRYRGALQLHYIEDRPYSEVVERLGVPPGTIKTWLHRGRNQVRASIEASDVR